MAAPTEAPLSPEQETRVRELAGIMAAEMIGRVLLGAGDRIQEAITGSIVLLPVVHVQRDTGKEARDHAR